MNSNELTIFEAKSIFTVEAKYNIDTAPVPHQDLQVSEHAQVYWHN